MKTLNLLDSACRFCRYYKPEGRRGGICQQLGAPVQGSWKACALAMPTFVPSWEGLESAVMWSEPVMTSCSPLVSALEISQLELEGELGVPSGDKGARGRTSPSLPLLSAKDIYSGSQLGVLRLDGE